MKRWFELLIMSVLLYNSALSQQSLATYTYKMIEDEFEHTGKLFFNNVESKFVYKQIEGNRFVMEDEDGFLSQTIYSDSAGHVFYRNKRSDIMKERVFVETNAFLLDDGFRQDWKVGKRTRKIGGYECIRAETTFRGREYIAWFSPEIPFDMGPWKFNGLPGLIMEVGDKDGLVYFKLSDLSLSIKGKASSEGFDYLGEPLKNYRELRALQLEVWKKKNERLKSRAAQMMAENPSLEIEIELPGSPVYTEIFDFQK